MHTKKNDLHWKKERKKKVLTQKLILAAAAALIIMIVIGTIHFIRLQDKRWLDEDASVAAAQAQMELDEIERLMQAEAEEEAEETYPEPDKFIALTFDDGPGPYTERLLDELKERDIKVTFFLLGVQVRKYPDIVKRIAEEGHELGTHTQTHDKLPDLKEKKIRQEIETSSQAISDAANGQLPTVLRPPGGAYDDKVLKLCEEYNLPVILWSVDPKDWQSNNSESIMKNVFQKGQYGVADGSIILMHDIYETSVEAAADMIEQLMKEGYGFMTVSDLMNSYENEYLPGEIYRKAIPPAA